MTNDSSYKGVVAVCKVSNGVLVDTFTDIEEFSNKLAKHRAEIDDCEFITSDKYNKVISNIEQFRVGSGNVFDLSIEQYHFVLDLLSYED